MRRSRSSSPGLSTGGDTGRVCMPLLCHESDDFDHASGIARTMSIGRTGACRWSDYSRGGTTEVC